MTLPEHNGVDEAIRRELEEFLKRLESDHVHRPQDLGLTPEY